VDEKSREEKPGRAYKLAFEYESKYGCCPQCVVAAIEGVFNLKMDDVFKAGHSLAEGVGLSGNRTCGALSGGAMVLSYKYGRERKGFHLGRRMKSHVLTKKLYDRFVRSSVAVSVKMFRSRSWGDLSTSGMLVISRSSRRLVGIETSVLMSLGRLLNGFLKSS